MARKRGQTIDWSAWKLEFIESDYFEVKGFLRDLKGIGKLNGNIRKKTASRGAEKKERLRRMREKALEKAEEEIIKVWKPDMQKLGDIHKNIFNMLVEYSNQAIGKGNPAIPKLSIKEVRTLREMIKTEKGEPTRVNDNRNTTVNPPINEEDLVDD